MVFMGTSVSIATQTSINCESVPREMHAFASGTTMAVQNLLGYAGGAFVPGVVMDISRLFYQGANPTANDLRVGFVFISSVSYTLLGTTLCAKRAAHVRL